MQIITPDEISTSTNILSKLEPGRLPLEVFTEICRLTVTPVLEVICLRKNDLGQIEVALLQRPKSDATWPGMYHVPGTVITATDINLGLEGVIDRICKEKLSLSFTNAPVFVSNELCLVKRGAELAVIYMTEVEGELTSGSFYHVDALPIKLIEGHENFIAQALDVHKQIRK